jgi:hypothetical protein
MNVLSSSAVITGLVPVIPIREAWRSSHRDGRDRPGHDMRDMCCPFRNGSAL